MIAKALKKSSKTIMRCRQHLGITGTRVSDLTEAEKDQIIKLARKGWGTTKISAFIGRSTSSVLKVCNAAGITMPKQLGGRSSAARLRALSFLSLGYSMKKVADIVGIEEDLVRDWAKEDADTKLPARRVSKTVLMDWLRVDDVDDTETWQCKVTFKQVSVTMRGKGDWLLLDPWTEGAFKSRQDALNAAKKMI